MERAAVGLGANLGDAPATLAAACDALAGWPGCRWVAGSRLYRSRPVEAQGPDFYNGVVLIDTSLTPLSLLDALQAIEHQHLRQRSHRNAPRTLDLDLLFYGHASMDEPRLQLPHPRLAERAFVLWPLLDVMPALQLPGFGDLRATAHALGDAQGIEVLSRPLRGAPEGR